LFGSIGASDIVEAIAKSGGDKLDKRIVVLAHPIKLAGKHKVELKVHPDVKAQVVVEIVSA
jgi:large subunit ribosomal protein L9